MLLLGDLSDHAPFSQHGPYQSGAGEYGTWDAKGLFSSITKQTMVALNPAHAVQCTQLAIKHALTGERGPVAVLYHSQALRGRVGPDTNPPLYASDMYLPGPLPQADSVAVGTSRSSTRRSRTTSDCCRQRGARESGVRRTRYRGGTPWSPQWRQQPEEKERLQKPMICAGTCGNFGARSPTP